MIASSRILIKLAISGLFLPVAILVSLLWLVQDTIPPGSCGA